MPPSPNLETQQRKVVISCFDRDTMDSEVPQHVMVSECFRGSKFIEQLASLNRSRASLMMGTSSSPAISCMTGATC